MLLSLHWDTEVPSTLLRTNHNFFVLGIRSFPVGPNASSARLQLMETPKRKATAQPSEGPDVLKRNKVEEEDAREKVFAIPELLCLILHFCDARQILPPPPPMHLPPP